jgi:membrane-bound lytic murein transglycosylase D
MRLIQKQFGPGQRLAAVELATLIIFFTAPTFTLDHANANAADTLLTSPPSQCSLEENADQRNANGLVDLATLAPEKFSRPITDSRLDELVGIDIQKAAEQPKERRSIEFSKEVMRHPKVRYFIDYFTKRARPFFEQTLARAGRYLPMIATALSEAGLPQELAYLALVESSFLPDAKSSKGAVGLWQFIPNTARLHGLRIDRWVDERRDPEKATRAAAAYLKELHDYYGRWYLAAAAYNAGPGAIDRALQSSRAQDFWGLKAQISQETRNYVPKFVAIATIAAEPEKYGLSQISFDAPLNYEEIELNAPLNLNALAELTAADAATLRDLNPALLRQWTPPGAREYRVKVPVGKAALYAARILEKNTASLREVFHQVRKGETLASIARHYGFAPRSLVDLNGLTSARVSVGQKLKIVLDGQRIAMR